MTDNDRAKAYLDAYDRVLDVFKLGNDAYFKRTQISMLIIQSALFVSLTRLAWNTEIKTIVSLGVISFLGVFAARAWATLIIRQHDFLEFCRYYLAAISFCLCMNMA